MIRTALAAALLAAPVCAGESKQESCHYQGAVMNAVREVRLDGVSRANAQKEILQGQPAWPAQYSRALPQMISHVYGMRMRDVRKNDLGAILRQQCLDSWDQIQEMQKQLKTN